jgi:hypothetical protein
MTMAHATEYTPLYGWCSFLTEDLAIDSCQLAIPHQVGTKLCHLLSDTGYTYLTLTDGTCFEVVKVYQKGGYLLLERGIENTIPTHWVCGTDIRWGWTKKAIQSCSSDKPVDPEEETCPTQTFTGTLKSGNCLIEFTDGVAIQRTLGKGYIPDGRYEVDSVVVRDGHIVEITERSMTRSSEIKTDKGPFEW